MILSRVSRNARQRDHRQAQISEGCSAKEGSAGSRSALIDRRGVTLQRLLQPFLGLLITSALFGAGSVDRWLSDLCGVVASVAQWPVAQ